MSHICKLSLIPLPLHVALLCFVSSVVVLVVDVDVPRDVADQDPAHTDPVTDRLLNKCPDKEQTNYDVQIGDGMDIVIVGENGESLSKHVTDQRCDIHCFSGDVKNPALSIALNHLPGNNIMSSFNAPFQNHKISEYPFNDSLRYKVSD